MKFGPVPEIAEKARPWAKTMVIGPPLGYGDVVGSLSVQVDEKTELGRAYRFFVELEDGDLERIQAGKPIEIAVYTHMSPVSVAVWP
jgi:hypothetical protein